MDQFTQTDEGNSQRFVQQHGINASYSEEMGGWYIWDGCFWKRDVTGTVMELAKSTIHTVLDQAVSLSDENLRKQWVKFALNSFSRRSLNAMIELSRSHPSIARIPQDFDQDTELICCANGVVNICTGEFREHRREDMITRKINTIYNPTAKCPRWDAFMLDIMCGDMQLVEYVQKAVGYSLTGYVDEDKIFIPYGGGANGKSTFFLTLMGIFSPYIIKAAHDLLMDTKNDRHPTELADLRGARMVLTSETNKGIRLNEARVKDLTGREPIKARYCGRDFFSFNPSHTIWLATNNRPVIIETTEGIWRRITEIPFKAYFPTGGPKTINSYERILLQEDTGILNWVIEGGIKWFKEHLQMPESMQGAKVEYRYEMDIVQQFTDDCCVKLPNQTERSLVLYNRYVSWCKDVGETPVRMNEFSKMLLDHGYVKTRDMHGIQWSGLKIRI